MRNFLLSTLFLAGSAAAQTNVTVSGYVEAVSRPAPRPRAPRP